MHGGGNRDHNRRRRDRGGGRHSRGRVQPQQPADRSQPAPGQCERDQGGHPEQPGAAAPIWLHRPQPGADSSALTAGAQRRGDDDIQLAVGPAADERAEARG
jgi:hypothetical protein